MPIDVSIIIVNYNVQAFLEQCLYSVFNASKNLNTEVIVIDNNSVDDSIEMLKTNFQQVKLICNGENKGFAYACNQGLKICNGKYALLLNPDTIIREDSLLLCNNFMNEHADAGALGVKMIDGKGKYLPESKRSLPTASSAFYKMFGLASVFPKSKTLGKYQLKYLDKDKLHEVEVLSGAFMYLRMALLKKIGYLDEDFFMYGEDIDLSYRIIKAGYKNYYFPNTTIIHFKGESTKKASLRYVKTFYNAMLIFAEKHYKSRHSAIFRLIIYVAIYFRATIALLFRFFEAVYIPIFDFSATFLVYSSIVPVWENYKFMGNNAYSEIHTSIYILFYIFIWLFFIWYFKGLHPFAKINHIIKAIFFGTIFILAGYSLLPEVYRFSRALIPIGAVICFFSVLFNRLLFRFLGNKGKGVSNKRKKVTLVAGNINNFAFINFPEYLDKEYDIKKILKLDNNEENNQKNIKQIIDIVDIYKIETIIFFIKELPISSLISTIIQTQDKNLEFKMVLPISQSIVGTQSVINMDELSGFRLNIISKIQNRLKKRIIDLFISFLFLFLCPVFLTKNKLKTFVNIITKVILGKRTWVSYINLNKDKFQELPELRPGIFSPLNLHNNLINNDKLKYEANLSYAKNYKGMTDFIIIYKALNQSLDLEYHLKLNKQELNGKLDL